MAETVAGDESVAKMKRVFMIHGWDGFPENHWFPWLKKELEKIGFKAIVPAMPNTSEPKIAEWVPHLNKVVGKLDEDTYFVGHSIGCQTILRYVEKEIFKGKIPQVVFVAGWFNLANLEDKETKKIAKQWLETPLDFNKVKQKIQRLTVFLSTDDPYDCVPENAKILRERLGADVIIQKNKGHFRSEDGIKTIPEVLDTLKRMSE